MIPRKLEPEVMDTVAEAVDYDSMDHSEVNRIFVDDFLDAASQLSTVRTTTRVLDLGTGTALIPIELCRRSSNWIVTAIDLAAEMLKVAERNIAAAGHGERIAVARADAKSLEFPDGAYEIVMSNSIVHHIPEPLQVMREMVRVLQPGGLLFVRDLLRPDSLAELERLVQQYAGQENAHQQQMFRDSLHAALTIAEVQELLAACDLPAESVQQTSDRHWTVRCVRG